MKVWPFDPVPYAENLDHLKSGLPLKKSFGRAGHGS
jgi:hypothetical protein